MHVDHILVASDLSGPDRQCYAPAAELAGRLGAHLSVLHVDDICTERLDYSIAGMEDYLDMVSMVRRMRVEELLEDFAALGVEIRFTIERGTPEEVIDAWVRDHGVDLVVMAQHSTQGPLRKLLGSTTRRVIRASDVPVLVIPVDDAEQAEPPAEARPRFRRLLAPSDLSEANERGLRATVALAERLGAELAVTHALDVPSFVPVHGGEGYATLPGQTVDALKGHWLERLRAHVRGAVGRDLPASAVWGTSTVAALLDEAHRVGADAICLPSTGKGALRRLFLGSVTESLVKRSPVPVLVLPPPYLESWATPQPA